MKFETPFQLLVATILSAQTTDRQVNKVTSRLFKRYPAPEDLAGLEPDELSKWIRNLGIYRNKSKHIVETSRILVNKYKGIVPRSREELMKLPGVGRKTANVVLANAFKIPTLAVDTHVFRLARRLGLSAENTPIEVEKDLMNIIPKSQWINFHHWLIAHGRKVCKAQNPECALCLLADYCPASSGKGGEQNETRNQI